jgi:hypothetical protein
LNDVSEFRETLCRRLYGRPTRFKVEDDGLTAEVTEVARLSPPEKWWAEK